MSSMDIRRRRDTCPSVNADSLMTTINLVEIAIVNTVRSEGTMFTSRNNYPENAMLRPLRSVIGIMESFMVHLEGWADRAKLLNHYEPEIQRIYKCDDLLDRKKFGKIRRWLGRIGEIDDLYCATFNPLIEELRRVAEALDELATFLNAICSEGNLRSFDDTRKRARAFSTDTTPFNGDSPSPSRSRFNPINIGSASSPPRPRSSSLPPLPSMQSPHPTTVPWKMTLSDRYPVESLYVSAAELEVFGTVLSAARTAKEAVEQAQKLCHDREVMANDMQQVYEEWEEKCLDWKENDEVRKGTKEQEGYEA